MGFKHSVLLDADKCKGCTHCLRRCPTEAIRVREGRALIDDTSCIDCGECIRVCPYKAKKAVTDRLGDLDGSKHLIALPAPSLFGQVQNLEDGDYVLQGLLDMGFDDVFEVSKAAELITEQTRRFMKDPRAVYPLISSACPVIVRLIALRFPSLSRHVVPVMPPIELAGLMAREEALKKHPHLRDEDIRTVFISPCPAKNSWIKNLEEGQPRQYVDYVISMSEVYFPLIEAMDPHKIPQRISESGMVGMGWAVSGGEGSALMNDRYLAADGIENVIRVLDSIENGNISGVDFIELLACAGGCVGGVLTVEDPYIAKGRLQTLRRYMPVTRNHLPPGTGPVPEECLTVRADAFRSVSALNESRRESIRMMMEIERILQELPSLDCGSCGAPTCRAFAEDVVLGRTDINECIFRMRERLKQLMEEHSRPEEPGV